MSRSLVAGAPTTRRADPDGGAKRATINAGLRRAVEETARELARVELTLRRLDAKLDDPVLATTHPYPHPQRIAAVNRHCQLWFARKQLREKLRDYERDADRLWSAMDGDERVRAAPLWEADADWDCLGPAVSALVCRIAPFRGLFDERQDNR